jgi:hypothetical protein
MLRLRNRTHSRDPIALGLPYGSSVRVCCVPIPVSEVKLVKHLQIVLSILIMAVAAGAQSSQPPLTKHASPEGWKPFKPVERSTLLVEVDPGAQATLNQEHTWELEWRPERHIYPGTEIELRSLSLRTYLSWTYTRMEIDRADVTFRRRAELTFSELFALNGKFVIVRARLQYGLRAGDRLRIRLTAVPPLVADLFDAVTLWCAEPSPGGGAETPSPEFVKDPRAQAILRVGPGHVERVMIYSHPMPGANGKVRTVLAPEDRFGNPTEFEKALPVQLEWNEKNWAEDLRGSKAIELEPPEKIGRLRASIPVKLLSPKENVANGSRESGRLVVTGNPVWRNSPDGEVAAFGEFHWHTEMSGDGARALPAGLSYAREHLNLDYISPSDHKLNPVQWNYTVSVLDSFNKADEFATFYGWEHTTNRGNENYYFTDPHHPVSPVGMAGAALGGEDDFTRLPEVLDKYDTPNDRFLAVPAVVNAVSETHRLSDDAPYWFQYPWTHPAKYHRLVEMFQLCGNFERDDYPDDAWRGWFANRASVQEGLAHGYKLGFTGVSDNHASMPASTSDYGASLARVPLGSISLTGLWTKRIERQAVFNALYARRTWAVWDTRAIVYFSINGVPSGDELTVKKGEPLTAQIRMSTEDTLKSMEIVSEGKPVWTGTQDALDFDLKIALPVASHSTYFYVRALQRNGGIIYASPVFVTVE